LTFIKSFNSETVIISRNNTIRIATLEGLLIHCGEFLAGNQPLYISVFVAGIIGSAAHCSLMCSPLVAAQMLEIKHNNRSGGTIIWYHAGRIATYMALGITATFAGRWIFGGALAEFSRIVLFAAGLIFLFSAISPKKTHRCCNSKQQRLIARLGRLLNYRMEYFMRGSLMGFMPCGMVFSVLLLVSTTGSIFISAGLMLLFGLCTIPALQAAGMAALSLNKRYPEFGAKLGRAAMAINGSALCAIALNTITIH
jgi:uncharacterized protein